VDSAHKGLLREKAVMELLHGHDCFPRLVAFGEVPGYRYLAMNILGPSLRRLRRHCPNRRFTLPTVLRIARATVTAIRAFHSKGLIHGDIKPGNFLLNPGARGGFCLIDFGVSQPVRGSTLQFPSLPSRRAGTFLYFSVHVHHGLMPGRRDDLLSWFYSLVELLNDELPWAHIHKPRDAIARKQAFTQTHEFQAMPPALQELWAYLESLDADDWPNYDDILVLIDRAFANKEEEQRLPFDWENLPEETVRKISLFPLAAPADEAPAMFAFEAAPAEKGDDSPSQGEADFDKLVLEERQRAVRSQASTTCLLL
jgi:serine/threonine protein kinase